MNEDDILIQGSTGTSVPNKKELERESNVINYEWIMLILASTANLGAIYCVDLPAAIETQLEQPPFSLTETQYGAVISFVALPNIFIPFFGGVISDWFGERRCLVIIMALITIGQIITTYSLYVYSYSLLLLGRLFLSLTELLGVVLHAMITKWFSKSEMAFPLGLLASIARIGSVMNSLITPAVYSSTQKLGVTGMYGLAVCLFGLFATFVVVNSDFTSKHESPHQHSEPLQSEELLSSIKSFKRISWALFVNKMVLVTSFIVFMSQANDHLYEVFGFSNVEAGEIILIVYLSGVFFIPLVGKAIDNFGKRTQLILFANVLLVLAHLLWISLAEGSGMFVVIIPLTLMGGFYAVYTGVIWPSIPLVVEEKHFGAGYGMAIAMQNSLVVVASYMNGVLEDNTKAFLFGYYYSEIFLTVLALIGLFSSIWLYLENRALKLLDYCKATSLAS